MKRHDELNDAFAYLGGDLSASERLAYEDRLERSASARDGLSAARRARDVWSVAKAPVDDVSAERWAAMDEAVFRGVVQQKPATSGFAWENLLPSGRALAWAGAMAVLAIAAYSTLSSIESSSDRPSDAPLDVATDASIEVGERGAIYAAGREERKVSAASAVITIAPEAACHLAKLDGALTRVDVVAGAVSFDVDKRAPGATFEVTAADVLVRVVGTSFTVDRLESGSVRVDVSHGIVAVSRAGIAHVTLRAGETVTVKSSLQMAEHLPHAHPAPAVVSPVRAAPAQAAPARAAAAAAPVSETEDAPTVAVATHKSSRRASPRVRKRNRAGAKSAATGSVAVEAPAPALKPEPAEPVMEPAAPTVAKEAPAAPEKSADLEPVDAAGRELRAILRSIGTGNDAGVVARLKTWRQNNRGHAGSRKARYAIGYCLFKMGDRASAIRIFESIAARKNPWVNTAGDYLNPPRPR